MNIYIVFLIFTLFFLTVITLNFIQQASGMTDNNLTLRTGEDSIVIDQDLIILSNLFFM
jgi:hypothetical protein